MKEKELNSNKLPLGKDEELYSIADESSCSPEFSEGCIIKEVSDSSED